MQFVRPGLSVVFQRACGVDLVSFKPPQIRSFVRHVASTVWCLDTYRFSKGLLRDGGSDLVAHVDMLEEEIEFVA